MEAERTRDLVGAFVAATEGEDGALAAALAELDGEGRKNLLGVLGRFDLKNKGQLDVEQRHQVSRVLKRLHRFDNLSLEWLNKVLDYLDLNANAKLEAAEVDLTLEVLEHFARAESDNATLSARELRMLYATLRQLDQNDNRVLDAHEKRALLEALQDPQGFIAGEKAHNPLYAEILAEHY